MDQDKFVFTAVDWLAGILTSAIVTGALCYIANANNNMHYYRMGWVDRSELINQEKDKSLK